MTTRAQDFKNEIVRHGPGHKAEGRPSKEQPTRFSRNDAPRVDSHGNSAYAIEEQEGGAAKPSRRSTRSSSNHALPANGIQTRVRYGLQAPASRAPQRGRTR